MRSMILISPNKNEILSLYRQWSDKAQNVFKDSDKLNMALAGERIYIDYLENGQNEYEESELNQIDIPEPAFYSIAYSDKEIISLNAMQEKILLDKKAYKI